MQLSSKAIALGFLLAALNLLNGTGTAFAKDHSAEYQMGTYLSSTAVEDGTTTNTLHGDGTTTAGAVFANQIAIYKIRVADGIWSLNTYTQNKDSMIREMGMTPMHFKSEKSNPLDVLRSGDRVLFRMEKHRLLNGVETSIYIPFADNPEKEFRFIGYFASTAPAAPQPAKATDNVSAMCAAHKLSAELEAQYCGSPAAPAENAAAPAAEPAQPAAAPANADLDKQTVANLNLLSCEQIKTSLLSNPLVVENLLKYLPQSLATIRVRCPAEAAGMK
jgi:hypothetical protein